MISTLFGPNAYMLHMELKKRVQAFKAEHGDFGLEILDCEEIDVARIREALTSIPFLASKKLVVLRRISGNKQLLEDIEGVFGMVAEQVDVLVVEEKPDKRTTWYKFLVKNTEVEVYEELDNYKRADWAMSYAKSLGSDLNRSSAQVLVERVGNSQQQLASEVEKLAMVSTRITEDEIMLHTEQTLRSTVFELLEAASEGDLQKSLRMYDEQRAQKVDPAAILPLIVWQAHVLAVIVTAKTTDANEIASRSGINPYVIKKSMSAARRMGAQKIRVIISMLFDYDIRMKRESLDADEVVRYILASIAT